MHQRKPDILIFARQSTSNSYVFHSIEIKFHFFFSLFFFSFDVFRVWLYDCFFVLLLTNQAGHDNTKKKKKEQKILVIGKINTHLSMTISCLTVSIHKQYSC